MDILCFHSDRGLRAKISSHLRDMGFKFRCYDLRSYEDILALYEKYRATLILTELHDENIKLLDEKIFVVPIVRHVNRTLITKYANRDFMILDNSSSNFRGLLMRILLSNREKVSPLLKKRRIEKNIAYAYGFEWGRTFIVKRELENSLYNVLPNFVTKSVNLFMALRELKNVPSELRRAKIVWVTDLVGKDRIKPHNLTILTDSIIRFIEENDNAVVLIDCVEYLLLYNDFINVLRNIELINSYVMDRGAMLIIITDNNAYTSKEYSLLRRYAIEWSGV